jgi:hypothetical protein
LVIHLPKLKWLKQWLWLLNINMLNKWPMRKQLQLLRLLKRQLPQQRNGNNSNSSSSNNNMDLAIIIN